MWVWLVTGLALGGVSPALLRVLVRRGIHPHILLLAWLTLLSATVVQIALPGLGDVMHRCWLVLHNGQPDRLDGIGGALSAAMLLTAFVRAGWALRRSAAARRALRDRHLGLARILGGARRDQGVLWLPVAEPVAYSVPGHPPLVVASTGLRAVLDADALAGVLAHERAHLARRHHMLVAAADAAAAGFWWLPLMRASPALVRTLVELDADAHAARLHGAGGLRRALQTLRPAPVAAPALGITSECTELRLARLAAQAPGDTVSAMAALGVVASLLSAVSITVLLAVTVLASCAT
ncbi:peptidase M48 [Mycolicibacterium aromaticivorans JS19b1 = JCM 16368]|uniref:Peptidase M48 n=1 Tax=Mycolicibacterium aromaticivorans JS19b1 = JCM 16368 TaxID=1440774 RepID=A0A064CBS7_9MYCO|nr:peptidase M48 [Mycolicibacterium aromaticivorans JS19b1 = JCM 16368]